MRSCGLSWTVSTEPDRSCVKVEVAVLLGYPALIVRMVSVDVKQH